MRYFTVACLVIFASVALAAPIASERGFALNTVISKYADTEKASSDKRTISNNADVEKGFKEGPTLKTVISSYADVERRNASPVRPQAAKLVDGPDTLNTIIDHYADVEGNVH